MIISITFILSCTTLLKNITNSIEVDFSRVDSNTNNSKPYPELADVQESNPDLTDSNNIFIHDLLGKLDPYFSYIIFMNSYDKFIWWINANGGKPSYKNLSSAIHETSHHLTSKLYDPLNGYKYFSYFYKGKLYKTKLQLLTEHYSIVEQSIPKHLVGVGIYNTYIEYLKKYNGNSFAILIDELNAYTATARFDLEYQKMIEKVTDNKEISFTKGNDITGMGQFMLFLQCYLKSARLYYPESYKLIINDFELINFIDILWTDAEELILEASSYINRYDPKGTFTLNSDYFKAVYSEEFLLELDRLKIKHKNLNYWKQYLNYL